MLFGMTANDHGESPISPEIPFQKLEPFPENTATQIVRKCLKYFSKLVGLLLVFFMSSIWILISLEVLHVIYSMYWHGGHPKIGWFDVWMVVEAIFLVSMRYIRYRAFRATDSNHLPRLDDHHETFDMVYEEMVNNTPDVASFLEGWFFGTPISEITRSDVMEWCAGTFFNQRIVDMSANQTALCNRIIEGFERRLGFTFIRNNFVVRDVVSVRDGGNSSSSSNSSSSRRNSNQNQSQQGSRKIILTLDPIEIYHKPFIHYVGVGAVHLFSVKVFSWFGFRRYQGSAFKIPFYYRKGYSFSSGGSPRSKTLSNKSLTKSSRDPPPLVFFHGLGIGLSQYIPVIAGLVVNQPRRSIVLFEMPSISMRLDDNHILPQQYASHVAECLHGIGIHKCIIAGHSIGTACVRWMDLFCKDMVLGRVFLDPICFSLWTHHTAHNALYRWPKTLNEAFIKFVGMSEAGIATFLHRYFVWFQNTYFTPQLPRNCLIYLAERDDIISAPAVLDYLTKNSDPTRKIFYVKRFHHGQLLASIPEIIKVIDAINDLT